MHFAGAAPERLGRAQVSADRVAGHGGYWRRHQRGVGARSGERRQRPRFDQVVEPVHFVGRVRPSIPLAIDQLLQHGNGGGRLGNVGVLERAGHRRHAAEAGLLGELPADLEVGIDARLRCAGTT